MWGWFCGPQRLRRPARLKVSRIRQRLGQHTRSFCAPAAVRRPLNTDLTLTNNLPGRDITYRFVGQRVATLDLLSEKISSRTDGHQGAEPHGRRTYLSHLGVPLHREHACYPRTGSAPTLTCQNIYLTPYVNLFWLRRDPTLHPKVPWLLYGVLIVYRKRLTGGTALGAARVFMHGPTAAAPLDLIYDQYYLAFRCSERTRSAQNTAVEAFRNFTRLARRPAGTGTALVDFQRRTRLQMDVRLRTAHTVTRRLSIHTHVVI